MVPASFCLERLTAPTRANDPVSRIRPDEVVQVVRLSTGLENVDRVFGDAENPGLAVGSVVQLAGAPGAGKSTLLAQVAASMAADVLYIATEESRQRLAGRVMRVVSGAGRLFDAVSTIDARLGVNAVCQVIRRSPARVVVVDSLQGLRNDSPGSPGSSEDRSKGRMNPRHSQHVVRDIALALIEEANRPPKRSIIMTCHLTKDGSLAGLREIEHMVDVVAWFKGHPKRKRRELSCSKNRDGETGTVAVFHMTKAGLEPVSERDVEEEGPAQIDPDASRKPVRASRIS